MRRLKTMVCKLAVSGIVLACLALPSSAQDSVRFDRIGNREGLTKRAIYGITQDSKGFMWFATAQGLYRFDGYEFSVFTHVPDDPTSISDNCVTCLCNDGEGNIWIGTESGSIDSLHTESGRLSHYYVATSEGVQVGEGSIKDLLVDKKGRIWAVTMGGVLLQLDRPWKRFERFESGPSESVYLQDIRVLGLFEDSKGYLWLSAEGEGIIRLNLDSREFSLMGGSGDSPVDAAMLSNSVVYEDVDGMIWVGTWGGGLLQYDERSDSFVKAGDRLKNGLIKQATHIKCFQEDASHNLWVGTANCGLLKIDLDDSEVSRYQYDPTDPYSLSSNIVEVLFLDRSETLWIGTLEGLNKYSKYKFKFSYYSSRAVSSNPSVTNYIFAVLEDSGGNLWLGTRTSGVLRIDRSDGSYRQYKLEGSEPAANVENAILAFLEDSRGDLYVGTSDLGLFRFNRALNEFEQLTRPQYVSDIFEDSDNVLWIATHVNGIGMLDRDKGDFNYWIPRSGGMSTMRSFDANVIFEDSQGNLWVGSDGSGLIKLFPDRKSYVHYSRDPLSRQSLSDDRILSLCETVDGSLWVGTRNGLNRLDTGTGIFQKYFEMSVLPDNTIYGILLDDQGMLWLSTNKGLCRFDPLTNGSRTFDIRDGILEYEFNQGAYSRNKNGELFFAGGDECVCIRPSDLHDNPHKPAVVITELSKLGQPMSFGEPVNLVSEIVLPFEENTFSIGYSSLDFSETERNRYAYKLQGFNEDWIPTGGRRFANFVHIPPGQYVFHVKSTNNDGLWSDSMASMRIVIVPPFWMTWEFRMLLVALAAAVVIGFYRVRTESIKKQRNVLQKEVAERREAESRLLENQSRLRSLASELTLAEERERRRISQMLHDRIGHALLLAKFRLKSQAEEQATADDGRFTGEMLELVDGVIDDTHSLTVEISPPVLYQFGFEAAAENFIERFEQEYNIKTAISTNGKNPISDDVSVLLYQALRELLINVVKHAQADIVKVSIKNDGERIIVTIKDNGVGMDVSSAVYSEGSAKGFGLFSIRERLEPLGGSLRIISKLGRGTEVTLTAPLRNDGDTR